MKLYKELRDGMRIFKHGTFEDFKKFYSSSFSFLDLLTTVGGKNHSFEVNIFEQNVESIPLQRSINNYIFGRYPYAVKIFHNNQYLASYLTSSDNLIQAPHDYLSFNFCKEIEEKEV